MRQRSAEQVFQDAKRINSKSIICDEGEHDKYHDRTSDHPRRGSREVKVESGVLSHEEFWLVRVVVQDRKLPVCRVCVPRKHSISNMLPRGGRQLLNILNTAITLFELLNPGVASLDGVRLSAYFCLANIGKLESRYEW